MTPTLEESREMLVAEVWATDLTWYRAEGNRGDDLIEHGTRALLDGAGVPYRFIHAGGTYGLKGEVLAIGGGGGWSRYWHHSPRDLQNATGFERVVVFPSTFDPHDDLTRQALEGTAAKLYAREEMSALAFPRATLAHCPSFFYDYAPHRRPGSGTLNAFRTDVESTGRPVPVDNVDVSLVGCTLDAWLGIIAGYEEVRTDRAHVAVAAALLGKRVRWRDCAYFKVRSIVQTWLGGYDVEELP